jgi:hypothetical protein
MSLKKILKTLDIFGQGISLRINGQLKSKTVVGGTLSILMIMLLLAMFFVSAQDVLYHKNPQVSVESVVLDKIPDMILNNKTFPIAIALTGNSNGAISMPNYFSFKYIVLSGNTSEDLTETELNLTNCRKEFFPYIAQENYDSLGMDEYYCIENQEIIISGAWAESYISYLSLRFAFCKNDTDLVCAPMEKIHEYIKQEALYFNIYFQDTLINAQDSKTPIIHTMKNHYKTVKIGSYKIIEYFIKNQTMQSDDGFLFRTNNLFETVAYDYNNYDDSTPDQTETLVQFDFFVSPNKVTYHRRYQKMQEVLASVGGLANILRIAFVLFCYIFSMVKRDEILLNKIFDFDLEEYQNLLVSKKGLVTELELTKNVKIKDIREKSLKDMSALDLGEKSVRDKLKTESFVDESKKVNQEDGSKNLGVSMNIQQENINNSRIDIEQPGINKLNNYERVDQEASKDKSGISNGKCELPCGLENNRKMMAKFDESNNEIYEDKEKISKYHDKENFGQEKKIFEEHKHSQSIKENKINNEKLDKSDCNDLNQKNISFNSNYDNSVKLSESAEKKVCYVKRRTVGDLHDDKLFKLNYNNIQSSPESPCKLSFNDAKDVLKYLEDKQKKHRLKFTFAETIKGFMCCKSCQKPYLREKMKLYNKSNSAVQDFLDITFIIQKLEELEKLKIVMFNSEQLALFNFISKEVISLDDEKLKHHNLTQMKNLGKNKEDLANLIIAFKNKIYSNKDVKNSDLKLFNLLNEELRGK